MPRWYFQTQIDFLNRIYWPAVCARLWAKPQGGDVGGERSLLLKEEARGAQGHLGL